MAKDYYRQLEEQLEQFDFESTQLALHQTLEQATKANIASLRWADLFYHRKDGEIPRDYIEKYLRDIDSCLEVLERMKSRVYHDEKQLLSPEELKKRRPSSHIGAYIDQMRQRLRIVSELSERIPDNLIED